jgi:lipopolysaccharide biosynthesis protein
MGALMTSVHDHYEFYGKSGPLFEGESCLPVDGPSSYTARYIAYYLPQFHAIPENDKWWGKGFTEWTNVANALPRFAGHYQPRRPADLGFYSLSNVDTIRAQASLAKRGGVFGFCIHDYWFSGKKLLEAPLNTILGEPNIDLRFCLNWANESWTRRWDGTEEAVLMRQEYKAEDAIAYAASILPAISDPRYIRIRGRPLLMIYRPSVLPDAQTRIDTLRNFVVKSGFENPFIVMPQAFGNYDPAEYGLDGAAGFPPHGCRPSLKNHRGSLRLLDPKFAGTAFSYTELAERILQNPGQGFRLFPGVCPNWDNEARRGRASQVFFGSTPKQYGRWLRAASEQTCQADSPDERIVFINAWNEWAEGTYLEPDRHFGYAYLAETRRVLDGLGNLQQPQQDAAIHYPPKPFRAVRSWQRELVNFPRRAGRALLRRARKSLG